jgi:Arc/MetJ-type ribon-helix-helix transcriptional regulator
MKKRYSVTLTDPFLNALDRLVKEGLYIDNQDAIRDALRRLFQYHGIDPFTTPEPHEEPR